MTTTVTPDTKQEHTGSQEWPTLADTTREDRADWFDPTQGRTIGLDPYPASAVGGHVKVA